MSDDPRVLLFRLPLAIEHGDAVCAEVYAPRPMLPSEMRSLAGVLQCAAHAQSLVVRHGDITIECDTYEERNRLIEVLEELRLKRADRKGDDRRPEPRGEG